MIHDESDPVIIDFSWFYFMGKAKFNLSFKETGKLTFSMFMKFYGHYKNTWDFEARLMQNNMTYAEHFIKSQQEEEWF